MSECTQCKGRGHVFNLSGFGAEAETCPICLGSGEAYTVDDALEDLNAIAALINDHQHGGYSHDFIDQIHNTRYVPLRNFLMRLKEQA